MNLNKAFVLGRLTRDPESKTLPSGQPVANFSVATNRVYNDASGNKQELVEFHNIVAFGKLADICSRFLNKGKLVLIEGRIQTRSWQAQDGTKRSRTEIVAESMQLGPRGAGDTAPAASAPNRTKASSEDIPVIEQEEPVSDDDKEEGVNVDNIPF